MSDENDEYGSGVFEGPMVYAADAAAQAHPPVLALEPSPPPPSPAAEPPVLGPATYDVPSAYDMPQMAMQPAAMGDVVPQEGAHTLGLSLLLVGAGAAIGSKWGLMGSGAGALFGGSALNLIRAIKYYGACQDPATCEANRAEARVSAFYGVLGVLAGGFLVYKMKTSGRLVANRDDDDRTVSNPCRIRAVG